MKRGIIAAIVLGLISGCAPKMGKDVLVEPTGHLRFENTKSEVALGILSLLGGTSHNEILRIGTDVNITNRWHSDMKLISLTYALVEEQETLAKGSARINGEKGFVVASNTQRYLPLVIEIDTKNITFNRVVSIMQQKSKMTLSGEAVVEIWGVQQHLTFSKDATLLIEKALNSKANKE